MTVTRTEMTSNIMIAKNKPRTILKPFHNNHIQPIIIIVTDAVNILCLEYPNIQQGAYLAIMINTSTLIGDF